MKLTQAVKYVFIIMNVFFAIYITSGIWKSYINIYEAIYEFDVIDITLLFAIFLSFIFIVCFFAGWLNSPIRYKLPLILFTLFFAISIFSASYSKSTDYVYVKILYLGACIIAFFMPLGWPSFNKINFFKVYSIVVLISSIGFLYLFPKLTYEEMTLGSGMRAVYLPVGYICGLAVLLIYLYMDQLSYLWACIMVFLSAALLLTGARGPIIFTFILLICSVFTKPRAVIFKHITLSVLLFIISFIFFTMFSDSTVSIFKTDTNIFKLFDRSVERFGIIFSEGQGNSVIERKQYIDFFFASISDDFAVFLSGFGYGGFGKEYTGTDIRAYPHNILLEAWLDSGVFAFIILSVLILYPFYGLYRYRAMPEIIWLLYLVLNSFKSFSIVESRALFAFLAIAYMEIFQRRMKMKRESLAAEKKIIYSR